MSIMPTDKSRIMLRGVESFGLRRCGTDGYPNVYVRVAKYVQWIHNTVKS